MSKTSQPHTQATSVFEALKMTASDIIGLDGNQDVLIEYFTGIVSCDYYDGSSYQLYLDTDDDSLSIVQQVSSNDWVQRDDGSMLMVYQVSGYADTPADERYTDGCDINDFGFSDWLAELEVKIAETLATQEA